MQLRKLKVKGKLLLAFSVIICLMTVTVAVGICVIIQIKQKTAETYVKNIEPLQLIELLKSDFAELRLIGRTLMMDGANGDMKKTQEGIDDAYKQYEKIQQNEQVLLIQLEDAGVEQSEINQLQKIYADINAEYWPILMRICEAAAAGDTERSNAELESIGPISKTIKDELNAILIHKMSLSKQSKDIISETANNSMLLLLALGFLSISTSLVLAFMVGNSIAKRVKAVSADLNHVAEGRLDIEAADHSMDEIGDLNRDLQKVCVTLRKVNDEISDLSTRFMEGNINIQMDSTKFAGAYREIVENINLVFSTIIGDTLNFMQCITSFADGDFKADIGVMPGDKIVMHNTIKTLRGTLTSIINDASRLVSAAHSGKLDERADIAKYKGDWVQIMDSINRLMTVMAKPIEEAESVLAQVAMGNFDYRITGEYEGAFRKIKESVNNMVVNMESYINEISSVISALADNDLDHEIKREYLGKFNEIKDALNNIFRSLNRVITDITQSSQQVAAGAKQISESSMHLASGATEQASAAEELNATIQVINQNTAQNAESAKEAEKLAKNAKGNAEKGNADMQDMLNSMEAIKASSDSISKIIKVIDDIAFQTNLLALNAAVEAARAGAQGKGFAVVAEEVRSLAARSQSAAMQTTELIEESIKCVNEGKAVADKTADTLHTIVNDADEVAKLIGYIALASEEQSSAIGQVTDGLMQITDVIQSNSTMSEETASASDELSSQSDLLMHMMNAFKLRR